MIIGGVAVLVVLESTKRAMIKESVEDSALILLLFLVFNNIATATLQLLHV